jgi:hypothetical protein
MKEKEMIYLASKYADKGYDIEQLRYGDDLNGKEHLTEDIWEYVCEYKEIGSTAFAEKYKNNQLY